MTKGTELRVAELPLSEADQAAFVAALSAKNNKPTAAQRAELARILNAHPRLAYEVINVGRIVQDAIIGRLSSHPAYQDILRRQADDLAVSLAGTAPTPLERLLVQNVVLCWLRWQDCEWRYDAVMAESHTLTLGAYWERKLSMVHLRYERALESLARTRALLARLPVVQVNIAKQQIVTNG